MPWTVLIVDDHRGFRTGARALLEAEGFDVLGEATDGRDALEQARRLRPQVVLLDVQLPGLDGFAVAEALAGRDRAPIVVLVSSRARLDYGNRVDESCAHGFIAKADLSGETLWRVIDSPDEASRCGA